MKRKCAFIICGLMVISLLSACSDFSSNSSSKQENFIEQNLMPRQMEYAEENGISITKFSEREKLSTWLEENYVDIEDNPQNMVYLKTGGLSGKRLERTKDPGEYYYIGELKDNQPNGNGILFVRNPKTTGSTADRTYCFQYIGSFEKGRYDGYGLLFSVPTSEDVGINAAAAVAPNMESEEFAKLYADGVNYVTYEGMFEKGEKNGKGNQFITFTSWGAAFIYDIESEFANGVTYSTVRIGNFKDDKADGKIKIYIEGNLYYDGEMKKGEYSGKGKSYYNNGQLRYEGGFKQDEYHGEGTLYDENGEVIYSGKWRFGDYD